MPVVDFVEYVEELERPEEVLGSNGTYDLSVEAEAEAEEAAAEGEGVAKKLSFVPESFTSPPRSVDVSSNVFKAYDFDKTFTPKLSKSEFNDAHSPVSASKYIERSLHDLDDLINLRRLELSELKRSHSQRPGSTQEYSNPLHKGKNSTSRLNSPIPVNGSDGSPNPAASPSVSQSRCSPSSISILHPLPFPSCFLVLLSLLHHWIGEDRIQDLIITTVVSPTHSQILCHSLNQLFYGILTDDDT